MANEFVREYSRFSHIKRLIFWKLHKIEISNMNFKIAVVTQFVSDTMRKANIKSKKNSRTILQPKCVIVYFKRSRAFLDLRLSECTCAEKSTCFVSKII